MTSFSSYLKIASVLLFTLVLLSCEEKDCCVAQPIEAQFHGTWELFKITNGFAQLEITGDEIGFKEILEINATFSTFSRKRDGKEILYSKFSVGQEGNQNALLLTDDQTYHWYNMLEKDGEAVLSLYENCPIGAILADGSDYEYRKLD